MSEDWPPGRGFESFARASQILFEFGAAQFADVAVIEASAGDLVAPRGDFANQFRQLFGNPAQDEKRGLGLVPI